MNITLPGGHTARHARSAGLDALRGLAVLAVLVYHIVSDAHLVPVYLLEHPPHPFTHYALLGMFGVDLFYALSGYFIVKSVMEAPQWNPLAFAQARVRRIYPAFMVCLFMVVLTQAIAQDLDTSVTLTRIVLHLSMLHNLIPGVGQSINGVFWTLGVEFPFYLLVLAFAPMLRHTRGFWPTLGAAVLVALNFRAGVFHHIAPDSMHQMGRFFASTQVTGALDMFALGGVAYGLLPAVRHWPNLARVVMAALGGALSLWALSLAGQHMHDFWDNSFMVIFWRTVLALGFGLLILGVAALPAPEWLAWTSLTWWGKVSFSCYLWHYPMLALVAYWNLPLPFWHQLGIAMGLIILSSWLSWRYVELPFQTTHTAQPFFSDSHRKVTYGPTPLPTS